MLLNLNLVSNFLGSDHFCDSPSLLKSALTHYHAEVIRALYTNKNLPRRNCFPEGLYLFDPDKLEFGKQTICY